MKSGAIYLKPADYTATKKPTDNKKFWGSNFAVFALIALIFSQFVVSGVSTAAPQKSIASGTHLSAASSTAQSIGNGVSAGGFGGVLCGGKEDLGQLFMGTYAWKMPLRVYPGSKASNRTWTLEEAYGNATLFPDYSGEDGSTDWLVQTVGKDRAKGIGNSSDVISKLSEPRTAQSCVLGEGLNVLANVPLIASSMILSATEIVTVVSFNSTFICTDANTNSDSCFNLLSIIGGTGSSDKGIIGSLTDSIYFPLLTLAVLCTGLWVAYIGLVRRQIREAFVGALWCVASAMIGIIFLLNPMLLAKAPMEASNVTAACVVGAFNGQSCTDGGSTQKVDTSGKTNTSQNVCKSEAPGIALDEQMSMTMNSLTCSIWKSFMLEPWSQGTFGRSFEKMDTSDPQIAKMISTAKLQPKDFCVPLTSSKSLDDMDWGALEMTGSGNVCNVAAYQLYAATNVAPTGWDAYHKRMYKVIVAAANDKTVWDNYKLSTTQGAYRITIGIIAFISALLGSLLIIVVGINALIFYIMAVVRMAFAPLFFLFGVHPGKGKKILFGYLEGIFSDVMKYIASAIFLIVAIALYGGVLQNMQNIGLTLIFILIITGALCMYRKQVIDLLGQVNMGGHKMSANLAQKMSGVKSFATATAGSAIGAAAAEGSFNPLSRDGSKVMLAGASEGARRSLKSHNNILGNVIRESDRFKNDNKNDLRQMAQESQKTSEILQPRMDRAEEIMQQEGANLDATQAQIIQNEDVYNVAIANETAANDAANAVLENLHNDLSPAFAEYAGIQQRLGQITTERAIAAQRGDANRVQSLDSERAQLQNRIEKITPIEDIDDYQELYNAELQREFAKRKIDPDYKLNSDQFTQTLLQHDSLKNDYARSKANYDTAHEFYNENAATLATSEEKAKIMDNVIDKKSGQGFTRKERLEVLGNAEQRAIDKLNSKDYHPKEDIGYADSYAGQSFTPSNGSGGKEDGPGLPDINSSGPNKPNNPFSGTDNPRNGGSSRTRQIIDNPRPGDSGNTPLPIQPQSKQPSAGMGSFDNTRQNARQNTTERPSKPESSNSNRSSTGAPKNPLAGQSSDRQNDNTPRGGLPIKPPPSRGTQHNSGSNESKTSDDSNREKVAEGIINNIVSNTITGGLPIDDANPIIKNHFEDGE